MPFKRPTLCFVIALAGLSGDGAWAGPLEAADLPASASAAVSTVPGTRTHSSAATGSRSLDLLIDLQPRTAGLEFNERLRRENTARSPDPAAPVNPAVSRAPKSETAGGLFGGGATPLVNSRKVTHESSFDASAGRNVGAANWLADGGSAPDDQLRWLLPRELLVYVRDHREMVAVIAVILLLLIWAGSVALARRRR